MCDEILVQNWLEKSVTALNDTRKNIENDSLETAQNRIYYAVFYAVSALATKSGFTTSKHHQLLGWFNKNYIYTKKIERDVAEIYRICLENRQRCDYSVIHKPTKEKLQEHFEKVERLIDVVKKLLQAE